MKENRSGKPVQDYWKFLSDLRAQFRAVSVLERQFFELYDLCETAMRDKVTVLNDKGERVSIVEDSLSGQQIEVYNKLHKAVLDLGGMLADGMSCFEETEGN